MIPYARVYAAEQNARDAVSKLNESELVSGEVLFIEPAAGIDAVQKGIDEGRLPEGFISVGKRAIESGHYIVAARGGFGRSKGLVDILDAAGPVKVQMPDTKGRNPSPLSDFLGFPTLSDTQKSYTTLSAHDWYPTRLFGLLTKSQTPWFGGLMKSKPTMGGLIKSKPWMGQLMKEKENWQSSFGFPLLAQPNRRYRRRKSEYIPYARVYDAEQNARDAVAKLAEAGVPEKMVTLIEPSGGMAAIERAVEDGKVPLGLLGMGPKVIEAGQFVVSVQSAFGQGGKNQKILDACGPADVQFVDVTMRSSTPLSDLLGLPVLADSGPSTNLSSSNFALTGFMGLLIKSGKPWFGGLMKSKPTMGGLMKSKPVMGGLMKSKPWMGGLWNNPAPLSSLLGLKTLTDETKSKDDDENLRV